MHVSITVSDYDATVYREIPADLLERLMATDDTAELARIAREIKAHIQTADDMVAESYRTETTHGFTDADAG